MTVTAPNVHRLLVKPDTVGLDLACLEHKASEVLADILVVREAKDRGHAVTVDDVRGIQAKAKFLHTLTGILRQKVEAFPQNGRTDT